MGDHARETAGGKSEGVDGESMWYLQDGPRKRMGARLCVCMLSWCTKAWYPGPTPTPCFFLALFPVPNPDVHPFLPLSPHLLPLPPISVPLASHFTPRLPFYLTSFCLLFISGLCPLICQSTPHHPPHLYQPITCQALSFPHSYTAINLKTGPNLKRHLSMSSTEVA